MFNLEKTIASWRRQFRYNRAFLEQDVDELERHIRDEVAYLVQQGRSEKEAFGPDRKYYKLTPNGYKALEHAKQEWKAVNAIFAQLWGPDFSYT